MRFVRYVINLVLVLGVVFLLIFQNKIQQTKERNSSAFALSDTIITEEITEFFPQAVILSPIPDVWTEVYDKENKRLGYILYSAPYSDDIYGFAGNTPLLIALDEKQKIIGTKILHNKETPGYLKHVTDKGLFEAWNGLSAREATSKQVDAVSGATYTSKGIINSFRTRLGVLTHSAYYQENNTWTIVKKICSLLVIIFAVLCFFYPKNTKSYRLYLLGLSVIFLGFWQGTFLSIEQIYAVLTGSVPLYTQYLFLIILLLAVMLPFITGKQFYCQYLCPFGALQELIGKITKRKINISPSILKAFVYIRRFILLFIIFLLIIGITLDLSLIEPFAAFNIQSASKYMLIFAGLFLVLSAFIQRPWCRFFCPTGQLLDTFKRLTIKDVLKK